MIRLVLVRGLIAVQTVLLVPSLESRMFFMLSAQTLVIGKIHHTDMPILRGPFLMILYAIALIWVAVIRFPIIQRYHVTPITMITRGIGVLHHRWG